MECRRSSWIHGPLCDAGGERDAPDPHLRSNMASSPHTQLHRACFRGDGGRRTRRGFAVVQVAILLVVLTGFTSLAVDWGRVQLAKTKLQVVADSAARAAAYNLFSGGVSAAQSA